MLLLSIYDTQERYITLLQAKHNVDPHHLASEESFLAKLAGRMHQIQDALTRICAPFLEPAGQLIAAKISRRSLLP